MYVNILYIVNSWCNVTNPYVFWTVVTKQNRNISDWN